MHLYEKIAKRLKNARIKAGYKTAKEFAIKHNIPYITYAQHESGKRRLNAKYIMEYSNLLGVKSNWLLGEEKGQTDQLQKQPRPPKLKDSQHLINVDFFLQIVRQIIFLNAQKNEDASMLDLAKTAVDVYNHFQSNKNVY
jgi:hypothetical protein